MRSSDEVGRPTKSSFSSSAASPAAPRTAPASGVITDGLTPSLHVDYKRSRIKQYHKEGRALRTETTINNPWNFGIGKRLKNLPALREVGFQGNRRLLQLERLTHDCAIGEDAFRTVTTPRMVAGQRVPALRFPDPRVKRS